MKTHRTLKSIALAALMLSTLNHLPAIAFVRVGLVAIALAAAGQLSTAFAQGSAFTYQGRLLHNGAPANGPYDSIFRLYDVPTGGSGLTFANLRRITASNGLFTTTLDFGPAVFTGGARWLEIDIGTNGVVDTLLTPRQPLTPAPYAMFAANAASVVNGTLQPEDLNLGSFGTTFWKVGGNAGTSTDFIGTTDDQPFDVRVNNVRVVRYRLTTDPDGLYNNAPNVIGGSPVNSVSTTVFGATISGGGGNYFGINELANRVTANFATVSGGYLNTASASQSTVSGGNDNTASGSYSTVSGGTQNTASGSYSTVSGGAVNTASGDYSFAGGRHAKADDTGSFVWADSSFSDFHSAFANQFAVRCTGGAKFVTAIDGSGAQTAGVRIQAGENSWSSISDRNAKKNFAAVNGADVLEKLASMPVQSWHYKWESDTNTPHLGPMAQDFKAAFYPGRDDKSISTLEFDGVALAAIQGLNQKLEQQVKDKDAKISNLENRLAQLEKLLATLAVEAVAP